MKFIFIILITLIFLSAHSQQIAPNFTVTDTKGESHELYEILDNGQRVVLDFFYVGCSYCQFYSPFIQQSYENFGCNNGDVFFLGIDWNDSDSDVVIFDSTYGIEYPSASGLEGGADSVVNLYNISFYTTLMVIDTNKHIIKVISPPTTENIDTFLLAIGAQKMPCTTSIKASSENNNQFVKLFNNPIDDNIISLIIENEATYNLQLINSKSSLVYQENKHLQTGINRLTISDNLKSGLYILIIQSESQKAYLKILKQ